MDQMDHNLSTGEVEQRLLAALCDPMLGDSSRAAIVEQLSAHEFASVDHDVIFRALAKMHRARVRHVRETLGAHLTRLGFPDIDVEPILRLDPPSPEQIDALLRQLRR